MTAIWRENWRSEMTKEEGEKEARQKKICEESANS
jgi:hypothetical protein